MKVIKGGRVSELLQDTKIPKMFHARQTFPREIIRPEEIPAAVHREMEKEDIGSRIRRECPSPSRREAGESAMWILSQRRWWMR